jgi:DNA-binding GntR family transcriptional regulator
MSVAADSRGLAGGGVAGAAPDRVYSDLRDRILSFDLPPGATLGRSDLARAYGVSQTPVREALQRLEQDGLVLIVPQSKTVVAPIDVRQLAETQFLRVAVETEVVRRLAERDNAETVRHARSLVRMQRALLESEDEMAMFSDLDRAFHRALFAGVGMEALHEMLRRRLGHLYRCQRLELPRRGKMQEIVEAHDAILAAVSAGDGERAAQAMRAHLSNTINRIATLRGDFPAYFTAADAPA